MTTEEQIRDIIDEVANRGYVVSIAYKNRLVEALSDYFNAEREVSARVLKISVESIAQNRDQAIAALKAEAEVSYINGIRDALNGPVVVDSEAYDRFMKKEADLKAEIEKKDAEIAKLTLDLAKTIISNKFLISEVEKVDPLRQKIAELEARATSGSIDHK